MPSTSASSLTKDEKRQLQKLSRTDEIHATLGVLNMVLTVMIAIRFPAYYWIWHFLRTSVYIPTRFVQFQRQKMELYLLDWCYMVTYLSLFCSILAFLRVSLGWTTMLEQHNRSFIQAGFAMASGPLAMSIFGFRNSIVFHEMTYNASVFIHLSPFVLFWCLRWGSGQPSIVSETWPGMFHVCTDETEYVSMDACFDDWRGLFWCNTACTAPWHAFLLPPLVLYLCVWSLPYFWVVLVWWNDWIATTKRDTLYLCMWRMQPNLMASMEQGLQPVFGSYAGRIGYMLLHLAVMLTFCSAGYIWWHSFVLHTLLLTICFAKAVDNGSSYMFRVFAYKYADKCLSENKDKLS